MLTGRETGIDFEKIYAGNSGLLKSCLLSFEKFEYIILPAVCNFLDYTLLESPKNMKSSSMTIYLD